MVSEHDAVLQWLNANAPGFSDLLTEEQNAIMHFSLLWSLFEYKALDNHACINKILKIAQSWSKKGLLTEETFQKELAYFKDRHVDGDTFTDHYNGLHLERSQNPPVVPDVLSGKTTEPKDITAALLIIVFRLRNNLFHGEKWAYRMRDQHRNFAHSNTILMRAIEISKKRRLQA